MVIAPRDDCGIILCENSNTKFCLSLILCSSLVRIEVGFVEESVDVGLVEGNYKRASPSTQS